MQPSYIEVSMVDSEDVYYIQNLNVRDIRQVVNKCLSLAAPILGDGIDTYNETEQDRIRAFATADPDSIDELPDEIDMKMFSIFAVLGSQLENPLVMEISDLLLKGTKVSSSGKLAGSIDASLISKLPDYDPAQSYGPNAYATDMKLLKVSFMQNAYRPFVECLKEMGFSAIVGNLQSVLSKKMAQLSTSTNSVTS